MSDGFDNLINGQFDWEYAPLKYNVDYVIPALLANFVNIVKIVY